MIALSVAKLKVFSPESEISLGIKQKNVFVKRLNQFRRLEVREKHDKNCFYDEPASVSPQDLRKIHNIASVLIKFFRFRSDLLAFFARNSYFLNFWSLRNLIKKLFHSRLLNMRLIIANFFSFLLFFCVCSSRRTQQISSWMFF